ncbi:MAG: MmcB family DNA repair protein, partial [Acetobacteraceae bacterium]|nr:MmcB family DNA repair protein [Acetobacteraceae bacterium]
MAGQSGGNGGQRAFGERDNVLRAWRHAEARGRLRLILIGHSAIGTGCQRRVKRRAFARSRLPREPVRGGVDISFPDRAFSIRRGVSRLCGQLAWAVLHEVPLPNGRRADILALRPDGGFTCIEVK